MKIISHRGNLNEKNIDQENTIYSINAALDQGFDVEIDIWFLNNQFFLGHDKPLVKIDISKFFDKRLWLHAKNLEAFSELQRKNLPNYFWHENDKATLVSNGILWIHPGYYLNNKRCIFVLPELYDVDLSMYEIYGICTDNPIKYKNFK